MKVTKIEIEQVMGIERLAFTPGTLTLVEGRNGSGKTSTLEAVRSALRGGHDPSLLRAGAERGSVRLVLEDGTEITKTIGKDASPLKVSLPGAGRVSKGQALVDSLVDSLGVDPMALLNCPPQKRAEYLADVMALEVPEAALREAAGRPVAVGKLPAGSSGLDRLEAVKKALYDERTGVNRTAKDKRATAAQLRETLPPEGADVPDAAGLRAEKAAQEGALAGAMNLAELKSRAAEEAIRSNAQGEIDTVRADAAERIREIEREREAAIGRIKERASVQAAEARGVAANEIRAAESAIRPELERLTAEIATAEAAEREHARAEKTREILAAAERDADKAEAESRALSEALERIDALKASLLEKLPIKGLEIREGVVFVDGLPFERVNSARQIEVAFQVAKLRAGKVGLIVADGLERFDEETYRTFEAAAASAGLQFVVGRVGSGELNVRTLPEEEGRAA
jgi:DNA repair exonuclease SbcCD ATPase subunit